MYGGNLLQGRGLVVSSAREDDSYVKKGIVTTLDAGLQGKIEEILKKVSQRWSGCSPEKRYR